MARLPVLKHLLLDCASYRAKDWFYYAGLLASAGALACSTASLLSFCLDYSDGAPVYHIMPDTWHVVLYATCLTIALLAALPPLVLSLMAIHGVNYGQGQGWASKLCGVTKFDNFYCHGSVTRYLLLFTLSAATIILANTLAVAMIHVGSTSLFGAHWTDGLDSINRLQRHYTCCGLSGYTDWQTRVGRMPVSCSTAGHLRSGFYGNATTATAATSSSAAPAAVRVNRHGCRSLITGEPAVLQGINNMLAFAGVLLLVSVWTRVERVAELTARDIRATTFSKPRHSGQAAAFVQSHRSRSTVGLQIDSNYDDARSSLSGSSIFSELDRPVGYRRKTSLSGSMSSAFLYADAATKSDAAADVDLPRSWNSFDKSSDDGDDEQTVGPGGRSFTSSNNSALDLSAGWHGARIVNTLFMPASTPIASPPDSVHLLDETPGAEMLPPLQPLSAGDLLAQSRRDTSGNQRRRRLVCKFRSVVIGCGDCSLGGFSLDDANDAGLFKTAASARLTMRPRAD